MNETTAILLVGGAIVAVVLFTRDKSGNGINNNTNSSSGSNSNTNTGGKNGGIGDTVDSIKNGAEALYNLGKELFG